MIQSYLNCEDEPIHIPGTIQNIGYFIAFDSVTLKVNAYSKNINELLSQNPQGLYITELLQGIEHCIELFQKSDTKREIFLDMKFPSISAQAFDVVLSISCGQTYIVEIIKHQEEKYTSENVVFEFSQKVFEYDSLDELFDFSVDFIQKLNGYDRVMIYKFDKQSNGQVVSESKIQKLPSYLHLHYPASDIPTQARELYEKNTIRIIGQNSYTPVDILQATHKPLDMSYSFLRSVSPIHLEYMQNMGVESTMTISLIVENKLWGLIACHNTKPHVPSMKKVQSCHQIGQLLSSMIQMSRKKKKQTQKSLFLYKLQQLEKSLEQKGFESLPFLLQEVLGYCQSLFECDSLCIVSREFCLGQGLQLNEEEKEIFTRHIKKMASKEIFITTNFAKSAPMLDKEILKKCAGIALVHIKSYNLTFVWIKKEYVQTIDWGGNPNEKIQNPQKQYLSPRESFERYKEVVYYGSKSWELEIQELLEIFALSIKRILHVKKFKKTIKTQENIIQNMEKEKIKYQNQLITMLLGMIEKRDAYTAGHTGRVGQSCLLLAQNLGLGSEDIALLQEAAQLHDIGKVVVPDSVLLKPGKLNDYEYKIVQMHLQVGFEMLDSIDYYRSVAHIMRYHHEKYDGSGYPNGIKGEEIPFLSHIMIVADAFDAMTSNRVYQKRKSIQEAIDEIQEYRGTWYHPRVVDALVELHNRSLLVSQEVIDQPTSDVEIERFSYFFKDQITGLYNEPYLWMLINNQIKKDFCDKFLFIQVHGLNEYNTIHGWNKATELLVNIAKVVTKIFASEFKFRVFGESFVVGFEHQNQFLSAHKSWKDIKIGNVYTTSIEITKSELIHDFQSMW